MVHTIVLVATQVRLLIIRKARAAISSRIDYHSIQLNQIFLIFLSLQIETFANQSGSVLLSDQYTSRLGGTHIVI